MLAFAVVVGGLVAGLGLTRPDLGTAGPPPPYVQVVEPNRSSVVTALVDDTGAVIVTSDGSGHLVAHGVVRGQHQAWQRTLRTDELALGCRPRCPAFLVSVSQSGANQLIEVTRQGEGVAPVSEPLVNGSGLVPVSDGTAVATLTPRGHLRLSALPDDSPAPLGSGGVVLDLTPYQQANATFTLSPRGTAAVAVAVPGPLDPGRRTLVARMTSGAQMRREVDLFIGDPARAT